MLREGFVKRADAARWRRARGYLEEMRLRAAFACCLWAAPRGSVMPRIVQPIPDPKPYTRSPKLQTQNSKPLTPNPESLGGTVMDRIVETDHFSERQAAKVTTGVLMALEHIHM